MQQVNAWANGYLIAQNSKPVSNQQWVSVSPVDSSNIQVAWTNAKNPNDGVIVSATMANANGLELIKYLSGKNQSAYNDAGSILVAKGDIIKWLLPFGGTQSNWSVTNNGATANMQVNSNLVPNVITSFTINDQNYWAAYKQPNYFPSLPGIDSYFWGFTVETPTGTNLLTNAIKNSLFYKDNLSSDFQWLIFGKMPILGTNTQNPAIILDSNTSSLVQPLYGASINGISSLK